MLTTEYYSKKTVADLRAMLSVAGIQTSTRTRKADLVTYVVNMLDQDHEIANAMAAAIRTIKVTWLTYQGIGNGRRTVNYVRQNGSLKLTAKQNRRVTKKGNREYGYSTKNLQVV